MVESATEKLDALEISDYQESLSEEQKEKIASYLVNEEEEKVKEEKRLNMARRVFRIEEDKEYYGFSERAIEYMKSSVATYRQALKIAGGSLSEEADFIKVDDTWLKVSKILIDSLRYDFQNERLEAFKGKKAEEYL